MSEPLFVRYARRLREMADGEQVDYDLLEEAADELVYLGNKVRRNYEIYEARG